MPDNLNKDLIEKLFEKYEQLMCDTALNILHNKADAEDVVQNAFLWIINNPQKISIIPIDEREFYLIAMVKHLSSNAVKSKKKHSAKSIEEMEEFASNDLVEETALENITIEEVKQALNELSFSDYSLMYLYVIMQMKPSEIAEELKIPEKNIRAKVRSARKRLIKILKKRGFNYDV